MAVLNGLGSTYTRGQRVLAAVVALTLLPVCLFAQVYNESEVKAAFLYRFIGYVQYPAAAFESDNSPYVIGILGKTPIAGPLQQAVRGKTAMGRPIVVKQLRLGDELRKCHILFVAESESHRLPKVLEILRDAPVLTVGESADFAAKGGMIGFFVDQNRLRFEINVDAARRAHLDISSKLLNLARLVKGERRG